MFCSSQIYMLFPAWSKAHKILFMGYSFLYTKPKPEMGNIKRRKTKSEKVHVYGSDRRPAGLSGGL